MIERMSQLIISIMLIRLTHTALDVVVTFISHLVVFVIGIAPASSAFPGAEIRLPAAATFARMHATELAAVIVGVVGFPVVVSG